MQGLEVLARMFAHASWANRETARSLISASEVSRAHAIMAHIVGAEWLWLKRLGQPSREMAVWPALSPEECLAEVRALASAWTELLDGLTEASLEDPITYTNSRGERWESTVADVLTHVGLHSSHHRGQIATLLREAGQTAAYTDFIEAARRGHLDSGRA